MKNEFINLGEPVPDELRLEVYIEAKKCVEQMLEGTFNKYRAECDLGLCLLLPCVLWDLEDYCENSPADVDWDYNDTAKSFPEISEWIPKIESMEHCRKNKVRLECIESAIKQMKS